MFLPALSAESGAHTEMAASRSLLLQQVNTLELFKQDGSANNPCIVIVNTDRPEANHGFEVSLVKGIEHRNFARDCYHIRKATVPTQEDDWSATVPMDTYPMLAHCAVLIRGPSQNFWHKKASRCHQIPFCDNTENVHETLETQLLRKHDWRYSHWLLVFPEATQLENHILSDDAVHVKKETNKMVETDMIDDDSDNDSDGEEENSKKKKLTPFELLGMDVCWRIAWRGGDMIRSPDGKKKKKQFSQCGGKKKKPPNVVDLN